MNTTTETRTVTPQWADDKRNLGAHDITTVPFNKATLIAAIEAHPDFMLGIVNGQMHIRFSGPTFNERVNTRLEMLEGIAQAKDEKLPAYRERTLELAKKHAVEVAKETFDFAAMFADYATRERSTAKKVLADYDAIIAKVNAKWADSDAAKRQALLAKLNLDLAPTVNADAVVAAIKDAYKPATVVTAGDML